MIYAAERAAAVCATLAKLKTTTGTIDAAAAGGMPDRQIAFTLDGHSYPLTSNSTAIDLKAALAAKRGCAVEDCYVVFGGRPMNDEDGTTLAQHGVGKGRRVEVRGRRRGGTFVDNVNTIAEQLGLAKGPPATIVPQANEMLGITPPPGATIMSQVEELMTQLHLGPPKPADDLATVAVTALEVAVRAYGIASGPPEAQALALADKGQWAETWDDGKTWHEQGDSKKALPAALVEAELAAKAAVEAQNLEKFGTTAPNSDAAAKYSHASWVEVPSALPEDTAPSARLGAQGSARSH